jgi:hypothetical protein
VVNGRARALHPAELLEKRKLLLDFDFGKTRRRTPL